jgi:hypothetical protein
MKACQVHGTIIISFEPSDSWNGQSKQQQWNHTIMTKEEWRSVAELIQPIGTHFDPALMEQLATAVRELNLPPSILERIQQAVAAAVGRSFQNDTSETTRMTISTRAIHTEDDRMARSWGFFLVERGVEDGAQHHIEVFVYPEES